MQRSESIANLADALAKAQGVMQSVKKDRSAKIDTKAGSSYTYTYADLASVLEAIRKPLSDNGLALIQGSSIANGHVEVETLLAHTSGQWVANTIALPASNPDPRSLGSLITYGRRYGLALVGVVTDEDDDGAAGSRAGEPRQRTKTEVKAQTKPTPAPAQPAPDNGHAQADADFAAMQSRTATAAPATTPATETKLQRPYPVEVLSAGLKAKRAPAAVDPEKIRKGGSAALSDLFGSDDNQHAALGILFGLKSRKDLTLDQWYAIKQWCSSTKDETGVWVPSPFAIEEARLVLEEARRQSGQLRADAMFEEPGQAETETA